MASIHRTYVHPQGWLTDQIKADRSESNHLINVLRVKTGDVVIAFDGEGRQAHARVSSVDDGIAVLNIQDEAVLPGLPVRITLVQAIPKGSKMDLIIEKATELGVSEIWPVITARTISRPHDGKDKTKCERWRKIAQSASKQCGTAYLPVVKDIMGFKEAMGCLAVFDKVLVGSLSANAISLKQVLRSITPVDAMRVAMVIGPEGDLTPDELDVMVKLGAVETSFGDLVLRVETAAIYALSIMAYEFSG